MLPTHLQKTLTLHLPKINQEIRYINHGGCGVMAKILYKALHSVGIYPKIAVFGYGKPLGDIQLKELIKGEKPDRIHMMHIVLEINNNYLDSEGLASQTPGNLLGYIDLESLEKYLTFSIWNPMFKRSDENIDKMQKFVDNIINTAYF